MKKRTFNQEKILGMAVILLAVLIASGILFFGFNAKIGPEIARALVSFCNPDKGTYFNTDCTTGACLPMHNVNVTPSNSGNCGGTGGHPDPMLGTNVNVCYGCQENCVYRTATHQYIRGWCSPGFLGPVACSSIGELDRSQCNVAAAQFCSYPSHIPFKPFRIKGQPCTTKYLNSDKISDVGLNNANYAKAFCLDDEDNKKIVCAWEKTSDGMIECNIGSSSGPHVTVFKADFGVCTYQVAGDKKNLGKSYIEEYPPGPTDAGLCDPSYFDSASGTEITGTCPKASDGKKYNDVSFIERRECTKSPPTGATCSEYPRCDPQEQKIFGLGDPSDYPGGGSECLIWNESQPGVSDAYCNPGWRAVSTTSLKCQVESPSAPPTSFISTITCQRDCGGTYYHSECVTYGEGKVCRAVKGAGKDDCSDCQPIPPSPYTTTCTVDKTLIDKNETVVFSATANCSGNNCPTDAVTMTWDSSGVSSQNINCPHSQTTNVLETSFTATLPDCVSGPITYDTSGLVVRTRVGTGGQTSTNCPSVTVKRPTLTFNCPVDQTGHATAACTTSQTVTIRNTAASGSASLTFSYNTYSTYGSVIIDTGSDRTIAQGGNKTYTPSFTLQSVLSTTTNAGTLTISSVDSNNSANRSDDSPQNINIQLVPAIIIPPTEEHHAPTIINLTATTNSITVQWTNPESYDGGVKIYLNTGGVNEHVEWTSKNKKCGSTSTSDDCTTPVVNTSTITGLNANTTYQVWVRGWLHSQQ